MSEVLIRPSLKFIKLGYTAVLLLVIAALMIYANVSSDYVWLLAVTVLLFIWPLQRHLRRQFTKATILGDKLRYETGFLSKSTRTIQLSKIQDVRVDQTLGQRLAGIGDLSIETAGESSRLSIHNIDRPQTVADEIMEASQKNQRSQTA